MLRVKTQDAPKPDAPTPDAPVDDTAPEPDADQAGGPSDSDTDDSGDTGDDSGKISPENAGYQGPDQGPFICANCQFFDDGHCKVVAGPVDHMGCCNNFSSMAQQQGDQGPGMSEESLDVPDDSQPQGPPPDVPEGQ